MEMGYHIIGMAYRLVDDVQSIFFFYQSKIRKVRGTIIGNVRAVAYTTHLVSQAVYYVRYVKSAFHIFLLNNDSINSCNPGRPLVGGQISTGSVLPRV